MDLWVRELGCLNTGRAQFHSVGGDGKKISQAEVNRLD